MKRSYACHGIIIIFFCFATLFIFFIFRSPKETFDPAEFPSSYKENLPNENLVLQFAENFRRQYVHLYRDRKPLLLNPVNECFVEVKNCSLNYLETLQHS